MALNIGMIGAENSHTVAIARVLNVDKKIPGVRLTHVWGETSRFAKDAADRGEIPEIVRDPREMIGKVDAVCVDHRDGKYHLPAVRPFLESKTPIFVDKPFCDNVTQGKKFLLRARELKVPVTSFSTLPKQESFGKLAREARKLGKIHAVVSTGPCDIRSKYGGVFFYGIHQVDMVLRLLGYDFFRVQLVKGKGKNHSANILFRDGAMATMNLIGAGGAGFHLSVIGEKGRIDSPIPMDASPYLTGIRECVRTFKTGKTNETWQSILGPVSVLCGLQLSAQKPQARIMASIDADPEV
ncbi:MAG: Gfo/Idh/MocA family oxidoreductase [Candidatus Latescibacterota bacterium]|nr:Gfo/Idh/MocA family oxidoreductase [Candidatus Latescibacterota bacterium]